VPASCHNPATDSPAYQQHVPGISCGGQAIISQSPISSSWKRKAHLTAGLNIYFQKPSRSYDWVGFSAGVAVKAEACDKVKRKVICDGDRLRY
ncbi:hypothetical protein GOODEAATRI_025379, partial [Goodea atripinnis]